MIKKISVVQGIQATEDKLEVLRNKINEIIEEINKLMILNKISGGKNNAINKGKCKEL